MASEKVTLIIPNQKDFKPGAIPFGVVTGEGVDNFDEDGKEYSVSIILGKKERKDVLDTVLKFWKKNKPEGAGKEPDNFDNIVREGDEGDFILYSKTQVEFNGKTNVVKIRNHEGTLLDPEVYGNIGKGSEGRLAVKMGVYTQGKGKKMKSGISLYLAGIKLTAFVPYEGGDATAEFEEEEGSVDGGDFKPEKSKKDKKGKKSKKDKGEKKKGKK